MSCRGYTLVELLVVISIIGILSVVVFVNFKGFSQDQVLTKGILQIQNALRFAQTNATTGAFCQVDPKDQTKDVSGTAWSAQFESDGTTINILCEKSTISQKTFTLEGVTVDSIKASGCNTNTSPPFKVTYTAINGNVNFGKDGDDVCLTTNSSTITFNLKNQTKTLTISKGGAIDVGQ